MHPMHDDTHGGGRFGRFAPRGPRFGGGFGPGFGGPGFGGPGGFAPGFGFGREGRRARRGDVRLAILGLLADGPANGYSIIKSIAERTDGAWRPSPGSVYPTLQQLVDEELISASGDGGRSEYSLTDAGRAEVELRKDDIAAAWNQSSGLPFESMRELGGSAQKLLQALHMVATTGTDAQRTAAGERLDQARRDILQILAD